MLGIEAPAVTPVDLMRAILTAPVDLLYFGGIGTYVKASSESHADAGDRATDPLRIDAANLRARVIGEGANLGFTQRGRVEAALAGRKINTDALDNSAGVDTSDHEVNIKIATGEAIARGLLARTDRDALLFSMTDEVAALVLRHNYQQSQAISVAEAQAGEEHDRLERFMRALERKGRLDRAVEFLPDSVAMRMRAQNRHYLTRPELCVLLAYAKIDLNDEILDSDLPDDPLLEGELLRYFPTALQATLRAGDPRPPPAPRDRGPAGGELAGQSLRPDLRARRSACAPARRPRRSRAPSPWCATPGSCATCGATSKRSTRR